MLIAASAFAARWALAASKAQSGTSLSLSKRTGRSPPFFQHVIQQRPNWISDFAAMAVDEQGSASIIAVLIVVTKMNLSNIKELQLVNRAAGIKIKICCRNKDVVYIQ